MKRMVNALMVLEDGLNTVPADFLAEDEEEDFEDEDDEEEEPVADEPEPLAVESESLDPVAEAAAQVEDLPVAEAKVAEPLKEQADSFLSFFS